MFERFSSVGLVFKLTGCYLWVGSSKAQGKDLFSVWYLNMKWICFPNVLLALVKDITDWFKHHQASTCWLCTCCLRASSDLLTAFPQKQVFLVCVFPGAMLLDLFCDFSLFPACFGQFWALTSFNSDEAFVFQIGEGGCVGTSYNGRVK